VLDAVLHKRMLSEAQHQYYWVSIPGNVNHSMSNLDSKPKMRVTDVVIDEIVCCVLELEVLNKLTGE
jgi:hypothetical protein